MDEKQALDRHLRVETSSDDNATFSMPNKRADSLVQTRNNLEERQSTVDQEGVHLRALTTEFVVIELCWIFGECLLSEERGIY